MAGHDDTTLSPATRLVTSGLLHHALRESVGGLLGLQRRRVLIAPRVDAKQGALVDGLRCADALKARRSIGRDRDEGHARSVRLNHGGQEMGARASGGRQDHRGDT